MKSTRGVGPRAARSGSAVFAGFIALILLTLGAFAHAADSSGVALGKALVANKWSWAKGDGKGHVWKTTLTFHDDGTITNPKDHHIWYWWVIDDKTAHIQFHEEPGAASTANLKAGMNLVFTDDLGYFRGVYIPDPESPTASGERKGPTGEVIDASKIRVVRADGGVVPAKLAAEDIIHNHHASLVIVKANEGAASGFICQRGQSTFLFTNIHVVADLADPTFTRLDGVAVSTGPAEVTAGRDIACYEVKNPPENPLEISTDLNESVRVGDEVVVPGNSGGGGVATIIKGAVVGIGPDRIEVSAPFIPGDSGSPIIHLKTGKVIGIATYLTMRNEDPTKQNAVAVRRFGYRIDTAEKWERVEWKVFRQDDAGVKQVSALTNDVIDFLESLRTKRMPDFATETLRTPAMYWMLALKNRRLSKDARRSTTDNFLRALHQIVAFDVLDLEPRLHYTYFRDEMREQHEIRRRLYDAISKVSLELSLR